MINRNDFYEPTEAYKADFEGFSEEIIKDWFNGDLIYIAKIYNRDVSNNKDITEFMDFFNKFTCEFKITMSIAEIHKRFKDYSVDEFIELVKYLINESKSHEN